jgi:hypothetical protein
VLEVMVEQPKDREALDLSHRNQIGVVLWPTWRREQHAQRSFVDLGFSLRREVLLCNIFAV